MNAAQLIEKAQASGIVFQVVEPDSLRVNAPKGSISEELRTQLRTHKAEIFTLLQTQEQQKFAARIAAFTAQPCASCGGYNWMIDHDGLLVCPCIQTKRDRATLLDMINALVETL